MRWKVQKAQRVAPLPDERRERRTFSLLPRRIGEYVYWLEHLVVVEEYSARHYPDYVGGGYEAWGWHPVEYRLPDKQEAQRIAHEERRKRGIWTPPRAGGYQPGVYD